MSNKAVFLDRDGTINVDKDYVFLKQDLDFIPNAISALKELSEAGFKLIIITNQSGIGRGYYSEEEYENFMKHFYDLLKNQGVKIKADYYCKHSPEENCECRKPKTSLIEKAVKEHNIDKEQSFFVGDKTSDILGGKNSGLKTILVLTGKAGKDKKYDVAPDYICNNLLEASKIIIKKK